MHPVPHDVPFRRHVPGRWRRQLTAAAAAATLMAAGLAVAAGPALAQANPACPAAASSTATSCTYDYTGAEQSFAVPAGVTAVIIAAVGGPGGLSSSELGNGGGFQVGGASVTATVPVPAGTTTLYVEVGSTGDFDAPFNGAGIGSNSSVGGSGGDGGGASDVRTCSMISCALAGRDTRLVVAGGGGGDGDGGGATGCADEGGQGGDPSVTGPGAGAAGIDQAGVCTAAPPAGDGGFGGTSGGAGGAASPGEASCAGGAGSLGQGGSADLGCNPNFVSNGGGGGGGYYGGGAGGNGLGEGGGGGAGSSFWVPGAGASMSIDTTFTPQVTISYTAAPAGPVVTGVSPGQGPEAGGTGVTITGSGFAGATAVDFGSTPAASFTVTSGTSITATAPAHADGTVDVTVITPAGTSATSAADRYTYLEPAPAVTGVSPGQGPEAGGTSVTITGTDFTGATAVHFGTAPAASFTVTSDTQITATAPAAASLGPVDVTVTTPAGTSATSPADRYAYVSPTGMATGAGRVQAGGGDAEFGFAARATAPGGPVTGHLEFEDQAAGVHIDQAAFTVFYLTSATTAHAEGTARCTIAKVTSTCAITVNATDAGDTAENDDAGTHPDTFTLTYGTTTVGGTVIDGHVEVTPDPGGSTAATPVAAAMTGIFSASLLGVTLTGGQCATGALVFAGGTAAGDLSCLLLGAAGINIGLNLRLGSGTAGTGTATMSGTATITIGGQLPVTLPASAALTAGGLKLTVAGIPLPELPAGDGGIQIG